MRTALKSQQALFLKNLWQEMDKLSASTSNLSIAKVASQYASEGYEPSEIVELLVGDGFDQCMSKACVAKLGSSDDDEDISEADEPEWGFEADDDQRDEPVSNFDLGCDNIRAATQAEAWEKAQSFIDTNCFDQYTVTKVYQL